MPNVGIPELLIVFVIALVVFGPKRLPELGRSLGNGIREFRSSISGHDDEEERQRADLEATATESDPDPEPAAQNQA